MARTVRLAAENEVADVIRLYNDLLDSDNMTGWIKGVYPTAETAQSSYDSGTLFVLDDDGVITATVRIMREQDEDYKKGNWSEDVPDDQVMVIHTLVVDPKLQDRGYATDIIRFYEQYALENGCTWLRFDTGPGNSRARGFYRKMGCTEIGEVQVDYYGRPSGLILLEKKLK